MKNEKLSRKIVHDIQKGEKKKKKVQQRRGQKGGEIRDERLEIEGQKV